MAMYNTGGIIPPNSNPVPRRDNVSMNLFPDDMLKQTAMSVTTPESVMGRFLFLHAQAHYNHLNTQSYEEHKALDKLYSGLEEARDTIMEMILGYVAPQRMGKIEISPIQVAMDSRLLVDEVKKFGYTLAEWAEENEWGGLENEAQALEGLAVSVKYLLTLQ